ncbi:Sensor protein FixL [Pseudooceanicola marinus]|uniref:Sensor protein FixL n=1 Tax=Pseudooceanicola marinus TaxID=396013 RepID=A0A1X7A687_9RHOB|nr:PAS domain S-box protein [Pseudooceanicola marinus]PJE33713.1 PAS domain S-box protein [Pseudooceanicola marinus]SLN71628.1 Sensor protein FixL [Pseudooceanicola marinus]
MDREQIARKLFEGMPDALVVADREGIIRVWNGGAERIFGFAEGEALGHSLDIITPERLRERHWIGYEATMRTGQTKYGAGDLLSVPAIRKDGAQISIQFSIVPLRGEDGDLQAVAAIMRDVTEDFEERKRLRRALRS